MEERFDGTGVDGRRGGSRNWVAEAMKGALDDVLNVERGVDVAHDLLKVSDLR